VGDIAGSEREIASGKIDPLVEMETAWAQQLGPKRFAQLRNLLLELNESA
jgi:hypothetical protein